MPSASVPTNEAARLAALHDYAILDTLPERAYDDLTELASFICGVPIALISLVDDDRQWFKSRVGTDVAETSRSLSFCAHTLTRAQTIIVEDALLDPRFSDNPLVLGDPRIRFYAGAPITTREGHVLGTVCVVDREPRTLSAAQVSALEALSRQVMELLESRTLLSEHRRATKALMQSEKLAAVGRIASSMAHEINNPLEAVTNLLFLARLKAVDADQQQWLEQADDELRRVAMIANQTLRFHKQSTKPQEVTCESLFTTTLGMYEARLRNAQITVEKRKRAGQPVACFEGDIRHVISNVLTNAIDAMPRGGRLLLRSREATDWRSGQRGVMLTIADTGTGMSKETQARMFEAFYTTKGIGGSGLGLWISADVMDRHGGRIKIRSCGYGVKTGTVVNLFLPFGLS